MPAVAQEQGQLLPGLDLGGLGDDVQNTTSDVAGNLTAGFGDINSGIGGIASDVGKDIGDLTSSLGSEIGDLTSSLGNEITSALSPLTSGLVDTNSTLLSTSTTTSQIISSSSSALASTTSQTSQTATSFPDITQLPTTTVAVLAGPPVTSTTGTHSDGSKPFLQNKALAGFVFGLAGIGCVILIFVIATFALRRQRRKRLRDEAVSAISFDPKEPHYDASNSRSTLIGDSFRQMNTPSRGPFVPNPSPYDARPPPSYSFASDTAYDGIDGDYYRAPSVAPSAQRAWPSSVAPMRATYGSDSKGRSSPVDPRRVAA